MRQGEAFSVILSRRQMLKSLALGAGVGIAATATPSLLRAWDLSSSTALGGIDLGFTEVTRGKTPDHVVARGYHVQRIASWGDPLRMDQAPFDPLKLTAAEQAQRFGYNNDFIAYLPLPHGSTDSTRGLLHINHEFAASELMFPAPMGDDGLPELTPEQMRIEQESHGFSVVEVSRHASGWAIVFGSQYARRVTGTTLMRLSGPAARHPRLRTAEDKQGLFVKGTLNNCAGGVTPWGTVLVSEENIDGYFHGTTRTSEARNHARYTIGKRPYYRWHTMDDRFDVAKTPREPNRFGWVVEYDPYNPESQPIKRTALGRFKHETATCVLNKTGKLVVYSGDDDHFEYLYRFVSRDRVNLEDRTANRDLLDHGVLSVARFNPNGTLYWLPLVFGKGPLIPENGFNSQADVLIETRRAADLMGATQMDRPEGVAVHPQTGQVYLSLTKNPDRKVTNAANPRADNRAGHIINLTPPSMRDKTGIIGVDHTSSRFRWDIFVLAGNPDDDGGFYRDGKPTEDGWFACPDNLAFDPDGNLWVATDGMSAGYDTADGLYAIPTSGIGVGVPRSFFRGPTGAEITGPCFTPDGMTLFLSVQHPGEGSRWDAPSTLWPDFKNRMPPRPTVVAITHPQGKKIGS